MKGIRDMALSEPDKTPPKNQSSLFGSETTVKPRYDDYNDLGIERYPVGGTRQYDYTSRNSRNVITVNFLIDKELIGAVADENSEKYDWASAQTKAEEIAYDRTGELLGKEYESKYSIEFDVIEGMDDYEVAVYLTPSK